MLKEAALFGLAAGVIMMAAYMIWQLASQLAKPAAVALAATASSPLPFGFTAP